MRYVDDDLSFLDDKMASSRNEFLSKFTNAYSHVARARDRARVARNSLKCRCWRRRRRNKMNSAVNASIPPPPIPPLPISAPQPLPLPQPQPLPVPTHSPPLPTTLLPPLLFI